MRLLKKILRLENRLRRLTPGVHQHKVYNCRSTASYSGDLALSATFFPETLTTHAVLFGCDKPLIQQLTSRLSHAEDRILHPMILPTIFAEMERNRQIALVDNATRRLAQRVCEIGSEAAPDSRPEDDRKRAPQENVIDLWMETSHLRDSLGAFRRQIENMVEHMDELDATLFGDIPKLVMSADDMERNLSLRNSGVRIRSRLRELLDEYDEHIRRCTTLTDGMNLAAQLEWNNLGRLDAVNIQNISKSNLQVVEHTAKDGRLMKSIAIITVVFLPATFLAVLLSATKWQVSVTCTDLMQTFFSMTFFDWKGPAGATTSPYIWIYALLAVVLSLMTFGAWFAYAFKHDTEAKSAV
ncbi:hypothetical protein CDD80_5278 [Ophiocordyceps camponoti-rufipedis]|uniref:Magnesium transporter n=1 Tax=Ophiocordyceps camponoti-rufipedis TaxID=2004952 RepID=A0A2C5XGD7_9HYPO|nr:hypothetical protein CDD80_5278 [Ophiocordyceps camponoti-rufipedis]